MLLRIVERLDPQQVTERWLALVRRIPAEERMPEGLIAEKAAEVMEANLKAFTRLLVENRGPAEDDRERIRQVALEWIGFGVSVEAILHGALLGATVSLQIASENALPEEQGAIVFVAERMMSSLEHYALALAPLRLEGRGQLIHDQERRSRSLVERLTAGGEITRGTSELAEEVGFEIADEYLPLVEGLPGRPPQAQFELASQLRAAGVLAYSDGVRALGLVPVLPQVDLTPGRGVVRAVGDPTRRSALSETLDELSLLVDVGCRLGVTGTLALNEFPLQRLLLRSPGLGELIERRALGPLEDASTEVLETVEVMIKYDMKRTRAAEALHVHPGTVDYRMRRAQEVTGLDLARPRDLALVVLALERRGLTGVD